MRFLLELVRFVEREGNLWLLSDPLIAAGERRRELMAGVDRMDPRLRRRPDQMQPGCDLPTVRSLRRVHHAD